MTASVSADDGPRLVTAIPGPRSRELGARLAAVESPLFAARRALRSGAEPDAGAIVLARGEGAYVFDVDDNRFVDFAAGFGSAILGHGPSPAHDAARAQVGTLVQGLGDLYGTEQKLLLMEELAALSALPEARVMLGQSGADAVTIALKTAVLATGKSGVLAFRGAYHGLSYAPLAACGFAPSFREPFVGQLAEFVRWVDYPRDEAQARVAIAQAGAHLAEGDVGAVLFEPVLGRGGVVVPPAGFLDELCALARSHGALCIADEIWTGMGRAGHVLSSRALTEPVDLLCVGKGLGGSFPVSGCVGSGAVMQAWAQGGKVVHTSTHAGAPFAAAAARATLRAVRDQGLAARAANLGAELCATLRAALGSSVAVRGAGLMIGVELAGSAMPVHHALLARGYLTTVGGPAGNVLVLTPPLVIERELALGVVAPLAEILAGARSTR